MNLSRMFDESCQRFGNCTAVIHDERTLTYRELGSAVTAVATRLGDLGLQKGDNIALMLPNCPEFIISYFAIQKIGAVAVTINIQSTSYELRYLLGNSDAKGFITTSDIAKRFEEVRTELPLCRYMLLTDGPEEDPSFRDVTRKDPSPFSGPEISADDPAVMIYTSGLTGQPLGAVLTHHNLVTQSELLRILIGCNETDRNISIIPFFHSFGATANMLCAVRIGAGMLLMERFTLEGLFSTIERERVTYIAAVPRIFLGMLFQEGAEKYDMSSLRVCITGGAAMPPEFISKFERKFSVRIMEGYGLTEASPACSFSRLDMPQKPGSIGVPIPGVEAKVYDDGGKELPRGEIGELVVRGDNVMKGYYKDAEATAKVLRDGWLHTGDLARIDEDGYIFLTGRKKRMIITSGFNVYPREVETILLLHPAVKNAHVESQPDLIRGEVVKARVVTNPDVPVDEKELMRHCRTYLSSYKLPRKIEFVEKLEN